MSIGRHRSGGNFFIFLTGRLSLLNKMVSRAACRNFLFLKECISFTFLEHKSGVCRNRQCVLMYATSSTVTFAVFVVCNELVSRSS